MTLIELVNQAEKNIRVEFENFKLPITSLYKPVIEKIVEHALGYMKVEDLSVLGIIGNLRLGDDGQFYGYKINGYTGNNGITPEGWVPIPIESLSIYAPNIESISFQGKNDYHTKMRYMVNLIHETVRSKFEKELATETSELTPSV